MILWKHIVLLALAICGIFLFLAVQTFPINKALPSLLGEPPLVRMEEQVPIKNGVVAMLTAFRPFETLGCLLLLLCGLYAVLSLTSPETVYEDKKPLYESTILSVVSGVFIPFCLIFALYMLAYGTNLLGGGIQGGIMLSAGAILFFLAFGHKVFEEKIHPHLFLPVSIGGLILFTVGFLLITFVPALANPIGVFPLELGLLVTVGMILIALFWALAKEER